MVPEGWKMQKVSDCLERVIDPVSPEADKDYREIGIRSHAKGIFHKEPVTGKSLGNKRVFNVYPNCFVVNIVFAWEQAIAMTSNDEVGMIASHRFPMFKPRKNRCDIKYITYFFKTPRGKYLLELASPGGAGRNKTLGQNEFSRIELLLPPTNEQKKIASILSTWDKAIETVEKLIANSQQQKKALMQQLLTGKKRLPGFGGEWEYLAFDEAFKVANKKSSQVKSSEYLDSGSIPIVDQSQRLIAGYCNSNDAYSDIPVIVFGDHTRCIKWIDFVFCPGADGTQVIKTKAAIDKKFGYYMLGNADIANLGYSRHMRELKEKEFKVPMDVEEQQKISKILTAADREIRNLKSQLEQIKREKKALMQQLLTGKRRVNVEEAA